MGALLGLILALQAAAAPSPEAPEALHSSLKLEIASSDEQSEQPIEIELIPQGRPGSPVVLKKMLPPAPRSEVFQIDDLTPGSYRLVLSGPALARSQRRVDLPVKGIASLELIRLGPGASLTGRITDSSGSPLPKVGILLISSEGSFSGETDTEGTFALKGLKRGTTYHYFIRDDVHFQIKGEWNGESRLEKRMVVATLLSGRVVDANGEPVGNARLGFGHVSKSSSGGGGSQYKTDSEGRFFARVPSSDTNRLLLDANGFLPLERELSTQNAGAIVSQIDLGTLRLVRGRTVRGRVVDGMTGLPVTGARLTFQEPPDREGNFRPRLDNEHVTSADDGTFEFRAIPGDVAVNLLVEKNGFARRLRPLARDEAAPVEVVMTAGGRIEVSVCGSPAEISRSAVDVEIPGMPTPFFNRLLDAEGRYAFENVAPGKVIVLRSWRIEDGVVSSAGASDGRTEVQVEEGATSRARIACGPIPVAGIVFVDGKPAAGVMVIVTTGRLGLGVSALTDTAGRFQARVNAPGDYSASAARLRLFSRESCAVPDGGRPDCVFELRASASK